MLKIVRGIWQVVPILECHEPLEVVSGEKIVSRPAYRGPYALRDVWLRRGLIPRLQQAARLLPEDTTLVLLDGWRNLELQEQLYQRCLDQISDWQGMTDAELPLQAAQWVCPPDQDPASPPHHFTGGAIDLTLGDYRGKPLDMGGDFDERSGRSAADYYERSDLDEQETAYRDRRRLLFAVMTHVGFSSNPQEWWHFDHGNQLHHSRVGGTARYGGVTNSPARGGAQSLHSIFDTVSPQMESTPYLG